MESIGNSSKGMIHRVTRSSGKYVSSCSVTGVFSTGRKHVELTAVRAYKPERVTGSKACKVCF